MYDSIIAACTTAIAILGIIFVWMMWKFGSKQQKKLAERYFEMGRAAERQKQQERHEVTKQLFERQKRRRNFFGFD